MGERTKILISEVFSVYENQYLTIKFKSIRLYETHRRVGKTLVEIVGDKDISQLSMEDIADWSKTLSTGRKTNTVRNNLSAVRAVLKYLHRIGIKCISPDLVPVPKREDTIMVFLTAEEVSRMIAAATSIRNKFIVSLLYSSGIRVSELISLDKGQICGRKFLVKGKGGKVRTCYTDIRTEELMYEYLNTRDDDSPALIISNLFKDRVTRGTIELLIKNTAKKAGITKHVTPHTLRHSFASNFTMNNGNQRYLQLLLGHASLNTTQIYSHVHNNELQEKYEKFHTV